MTKISRILYVLTITDIQHYFWCSFVKCLMISDWRLGYCQPRWRSCPVSKFSGGHKSSRVSCSCVQRCSEEPHVSFRSLAAWDVCLSVWLVFTSLNINYMKWNFVTAAEKWRQVYSHVMLKPNMPVPLPYDREILLYMYVFLGHAVQNWLSR